MVAPGIEPRTPSLRVQMIYVKADRQTEKINIFPPENTRNNPWNGCSNLGLGWFKALFLLLPRALGRPLGRNLRGIGQAYNRKPSQEPGFVSGLSTRTDYALVGQKFDGKKVVFGSNIPRQSACSLWIMHHFDSHFWTKLEEKMRREGGLSQYWKKLRTTETWGLLEILLVWKRVCFLLGSTKRIGFWSQ